MLQGSDLTGSGMQTDAAFGQEEEGSGRGAQPQLSKAEGVLQRAAAPPAPCGKSQPER